MKKLFKMQEDEETKTKREVTNRFYTLQKAKNT